MAGKIEIDSERCKGCEYCTTVCPVKIIVMSDKANSHSYHYPIVTDMSKCTGCKACSIICPDIAIEVWREEGKKK